MLMILWPLSMNHKCSFLVASRMGNSFQKNFHLFCQDPSEESLSMTERALWSNKTWNSKLFLDPGVAAYAVYIAQPLVFMTV